MRGRRGANAGLLALAATRCGARDLRSLTAAVFSSAAEELRRRGGRWEGVTPRGLRRDERRLRARHHYEI